MGRDSHATPRDRRLWLSAAAGILILAIAVLYFLQTRDVTVLLVGLALAFVVVAGTWVFRDARRQGMPAWPWLGVVALTQVLGLVAYLAVRELRGRPG